MLTQHLPAVRIIHIPTNTKAEANCDHRVGRLRKMAMNLLKSKLAFKEDRNTEIVRDYTDWSDKDWEKPELRLEKEMSLERGKEI